MAIPGPGECDRKNGTSRRRRGESERPISFRKQETDGDVPAAKAAHSRHRVEIFCWTRNQKIAQGVH